MVCSCHKQAKLLREGHGNVLILVQNRLIPYCMKNMNGICTAEVVKQSVVKTLTAIMEHCKEKSCCFMGPPVFQCGRSDLPAHCWVPQPRNVLEGGSSFHFLPLSWDKI